MWRRCEESVCGQEFPPQQQLPQVLPMSSTPARCCQQAGVCGAGGQLERGCDWRFGPAVLLSSVFLRPVPALFFYQPAWRLFIIVVSCNTTYVHAEGSVLLPPDVVGSGACRVEGGIHALELAAAASCCSNSVPAPPAAWPLGRYVLGSWPAATGWRCWAGACRRRHWS